MAHKAKGYVVKIPSFGPETRPSGDPAQITVIGLVNIIPEIFICIYI